MKKFSAEMMKHCGIKVIDMSISDIEIVNPGLSHALAQAAVKATELEMAKIDRDVETQRANTVCSCVNFHLCSALPFPTA